MSRAFPLAIVIGYDIVEAHSDGIGKPNWLQSIDTFLRACERIANVKEVEGPLVNGIVAVTIEHRNGRALNPQVYLDKLNRIGERVYGPFPAKPARNASVTRKRP